MFLRGHSSAPAVSGYFAWGCFRHFCSWGGCVAGRDDVAAKQARPDGSIPLAPEKNSGAKSPGWPGSADLPKNSFDFLRKSVHALFYLIPTKRDVRERHERGMGGGGRGQRWAGKGLQGGYSP